MTNVNFLHHDGFPPLKLNHIIFRGFLFDHHGTFLTGELAAAYFEAITSAQELFETLTRIDGIFTVCIEKEDELWVGTDTMGLFALYYHWDGTQWIISDSAEFVCRSMNTREPNQQVVPEFLSAGFVMGRETLYGNLFRTRPAEQLVLKNDGSSQGRIYAFFLPDSFSIGSVMDHHQTLEMVLKAVCARLIHSLQGRTAVVPLSGGYDSRLIACMLKRAGYQQVICLTYGRPNKESEISQKVAQALGYQWIFVDYRTIDPARAMGDELFQQYASYAGNLTSMPFLQEYFAVKTLHEKGMIPEDAIFIPGHTGDYLAGSYVEKTAVCEKGGHSRSAWLLKKYFHFIPPDKAMGDVIKSRLDQWFEKFEFPALTPTPGYDPLVEDWDLKEKLSKFVFNSSRVFPFFGYQFRFPLWDKQLRDFFRRTPYPLRSFKFLYDQHLESRYFKPLGVYFGKEEIRERKQDLRMQQYKNLLKPFVPAWIKNHRLQKRDYLCYHQFTGQLAVEMTKKGIKPAENYSSYNALICQWYLEKIKSLSSHYQQK